MAISEEVQSFIEDNIDLIELNTKDSWKQIYKNLPWNITGDFTQVILDAGINDPAEIMRYIPAYYLDFSCLDSYKIPDKVTEISRYAFFECGNLTSITIPNSVTSIGGAAFLNCKKLISAEIGNGVTSIGDAAFSNCSSLTNVTIGASVTSIEEQVFKWCNSLTEIQYKGTMKAALTKLKVRNKRWRQGSSIQKIICTDGEISLQ